MEGAKIQKKIWLNALLFIITVFSTFFVGLGHSLSFLYGDIINLNPEAALKIDVFADPQIISLTLIYTVVLLGILLGHEFGHYLAAGNLARNISRWRAGQLSVFHASEHARWQARESA